MAKFQPSQETINLGKKIVKEFSEDEARDLTLQWMAHYIAELINSVEQEKSPVKKKKLQQECASVIEDLWKKRAYFRGNTRPLSNIGEVIPILKALVENESEDFSWRRFRDYEDDTPWGDFIQKIRRSMDDILSISICATVGEEALGKEKDWLKHKTKLSIEEKLIIEHLERLLDKRDSLINIIFTMDSNAIENPKKSTDTLDKIMVKLSEIISKQNKYLEDLIKQIKPKHQVKTRKRGL